MSIFSSVFAADDNAAPEQDNTATAESDQPSNDAPYEDDPTVPDTAPPPPEDLSPEG